MHTQINKIMIIGIKNTECQFESPTVGRQSPIYNVHWDGQMRLVSVNKVIKQH